MSKSEQLWSQDFSTQMESDDEKREKKQKLIQTVGKYGIPLVRKQSIELDVSQKFRLIEVS